MGERGEQTVEGLAFEGAGVAHEPLTGWEADKGVKESAFTRCADAGTQDNGEQIFGGVFVE